MKGRIRSTKIAIRRTETAIVLSGFLLFLAMGQCLGQVSTPGPRLSEDFAALVGSLVSGEDISREDLAKLDNGVIRVQSRSASTPATGDVEIFPVEAGTDKKIYVLKMESRTEQAQELLELQRNLLKNQLTVLKVLGIIGKHQEVMGQRLSRTENLNRELLSGVQDTGRGVDMARLDITSTLAETTDISEMTEELTIAVEDIQKQLEDVETAMSGLQDTSNEILATVEDMAY